jgi:acetylornithine deacetylase/succinyl-diaminopimelate desuccinylase-like protein
MRLRDLEVLAAIVLGACLAGGGRAADSAADTASNRRAREIFKELTEINTSDSVGSVTAAAEAMAKRFRDAGFSAADVVIAGGPNEKKKNLVVRVHGSGQHKPVLLLGHLDVVEARREDWSTDPYRFLENDGYFYGRGASDTKENDAIMVATLLRMKQEGFRPDRDIILALTADEEGGCCNGVDWLIKNRRDLVDADFVINTDGWSLRSEKGVPIMFRLGASEKLYGDYYLSVTNRGGHSSEPRADNAIYALSQALLNLSRYQFPFELNNVSRPYFERLAALSAPQRAADIRGILRSPPDAEAVARLSREPSDNAVMRTNCVATMLGGGHAPNALPQAAHATVNCRILPGHSLQEVREQLVRVIDDPQISVRFVTYQGKVIDKDPGYTSFAPPPLKPEVMKPLDRVVAAMWPGIPVFPSMDAGASDAIYTNAAGMPTYGISGIAIDVDDVRAHGRDERVGVAVFYTGNTFFYRYLKAATSP